jgi:hypothetical protein
MDLNRAKKIVSSFKKLNNAQTNLVLRTPYDCNFNLYVGEGQTFGINLYKENVELLNEIIKDNPVTNEDKYFLFSKFNFDLDNEMLQFNNIKMQNEYLDSVESNIENGINKVSNFFNRYSQLSDKFDFYLRNQSLIDQLSTLKNS